MKKLGLLMLIVFTLFGIACQKQISAVNTNSNAVNSTKVENSNQKSEQVSALQGIKPPEPCKWFEGSLKLKANEYKQSPSMPDLYYCTQANVLVNNSSFNYQATGDAENIKEFYLSVIITPRNNEKQNSDLHRMLSLAAMDVADKAGGQKLSEDILSAILSGDTKEFTLEAGADQTKPQIKTVAVKHDERNGRNGFSYVRSVTMRF